MSLLKKIFKIIKNVLIGPDIKRVYSRKRSGTVRRRVKKKQIVEKRKTKTVSKRVASSRQAAASIQNSRIKKKLSPKVLKPIKGNLKSQNDKRVLLGEITHYFDKIRVCVVRIDSGMIKKGDKILLEWKSGSFEQVVNSMQIENDEVVSAKMGQLIGLKVKQAVAVGAKVYKAV